MRILLLTASALALTFATSSLAQGNGNRGGGGGKAERAQGGGQGGGQRADRPGRGNGGGQRAERGNRGGGDDRGRQQRAGRGNRGGGNDANRNGGGNRGEARQAERQAERVARGNGRGRDMAERRAERRNDDIQGRGNRPDRAEDRARERMAAPGRGQERARQRMTQRRAVQITNADNIARLGRDDLALVRGCPPGLAKKNNGCMPPGQARRQGQPQNWYSSWWAYPEASNLSYGDGYLYRLNQSGSVASYVPLLGGALWPGNEWPQNFDAYPVPDYHVDYFGLGEGMDYQYADGAIFGLDPQNDAIRQIMALVTGDDWGIGQQMPNGYDIYNVPYEYRDQYYDTPESMYRYSDGYVYQVDPTTQLIQAAIQLIT